MSAWLEQTAGRGDAPAPGAAAPRRPWATYNLAATIAVVSCLVLLVVVALVVAGRVLGLYYGIGAFAGTVVQLAVIVALAGLVAAAVIAVIVAARRPALAQSTSRTPAALPAVPPATGSPGRRRVILLGVAAMIVAASLLLFLMFDALSLGYGVLGKLVMLGATAVAAAGVVAAVVVVAVALLPGRATTLRTRTFGVIVIVVLIPSLCLAAFGVWAYYKNWDRASVLFQDQANYRAMLLEQEILGLDRSPARFTPAEKARLSGAIVSQRSWYGHPEGAVQTTLSYIRQNRALPNWAVKALKYQGYAIGTSLGPDTGEDLHGGEIVAWIGKGGIVNVYAPLWSSPTTFSAYAPVGRLLWVAALGVGLIVLLGLLGAWILSRSVVRPVRRLAEASGRLAEGEAGVTVTPQGPKELRELAVSFNDMNAKLTKAQETEQAFLLSVSHELKTPLTSVRGYAEGIADGTVEPAEGAAVIGAESARLERLVGDLLESGRMRKSAFTVRREDVELAAVAGDVARRYEATARDAGLTLLLQTGAGGDVTADHDRVLQVVSNLVENAIRCTPAPGSVTITTAPSAITVSDTGRGLTSDDLPRAFERFYLYSRYGTDRPVGTGLGLAIVKELTEAMGGSVGVSSAVGVGTAFTVTLPAADFVRPPAAAAPDEAATTIAPAPAPSVKDDVS